MGLVQRPVGVGRPDDPVPSPRDDEQHRLLGAQDDAALGVDTVTRDDEVHALGCPHVELAALADQRLGVIGPHASRVDDLAGQDVELAAGHLVERPNPRNPLALTQKPYCRNAGRDVGAVGRCRASELHGMPRVVHLRVVVLHGTDQRGRLEGRGDLERLAPGEVLVPGQPGRVPRRPGHRVVERQAGLDVGPLDHRFGQRVEERHRSHQVRGEAGEQQPALLERLGDEPEVEHLQVAQAAVDELAAAAGRARGEVALLDEPRAQAPGHRVQGAAGARHPTADDEDVEFLARGEAVDGG
ncbi:MAG: hypothetical protein BWY91_02931 [bacterium ADurb.BinA028]|nr:MAG: hypothetical protein BWY91_02931 [bacterium ADurb.BinA028]